MDREKQLEFLAKASNSDKKAILRSINNIGTAYFDTLFQKLANYDKESMLQCMDEKNLKELFKYLSPQSRYVFLQLLPAEQLGAFKQEIEKSKTIHNKYKNISHINYSVNFMRINSLPASSIFPYDKQDAFVANIAKWSKCNDKINIWYDGLLVNKSSVEATSKIFEDSGCKNVHLKDIRELKIIKDNNWAFSKNDDTNYKWHDFLPVYFRVDLSRAIAAYETATNQSKEYFVYADLDMEPTSKAILFDPDTLYNIEQFGIVMAHGGNHGFENGFQIVGNNKQLLKAMKSAIIDVNLKRAEYALENGYYVGASGYIDQVKMKPLQQIVYDSYPDMFKLAYYLQGLAKLQFKNNAEYDYNKDDLEPFTTNGGSPCSELIATNFDESIKEFPANRGLWFPTKEVRLPLAEHNYNG